MHLGLCLTKARQEQMSFISQGQYWLAEQARLYVKALLAMKGTRPTTDVQPFVADYRLVWPTRKVEKQLRAAKNLEWQSAAAWKQAVCEHAAGSLGAKHGGIQTDAWRPATLKDAKVEP